MGAWMAAADRLSRGIARLRPSYVQRAAGDERGAAGGRFQPQPTTPSSEQPPTVASSHLCGAEGRGIGSEVGGCACGKGVGLGKGVWCGPLLRAVVLDSPNGHWRSEASGGLWCAHTHRPHSTTPLLVCIVGNRDCSRVDRPISTTSRRSDPIQCNPIQPDTHHRTLRAYVYHPPPSQEAALSPRNHKERWRRGWRRWRRRQRGRRRRLRGC